MHVLDVYRKRVIQEEPSHPTPQPKQTNRDWSCFEAQDEEYFIRSAIALQEVGISFKKSKTKSLKDFSFDRGVLRLPTLLLDNNIEYIFLNLIAFERLHIGIGNEITSFIFLIGTIIDGAMDVSILSQNGILINILGNDQVVANLFNSMSKDICVEITKELDEMMESMSHYYKKPWKRWRASLIRTYFRSPWAMVSLVVAIFIFIFTIIQTIYTVRQFYQKEC